jgi:hypothetical protein
VTDEAAKLAEELRGLAIEMHRRCYSHVPQWKPSTDPRGLLSQIDNMVAGMMADNQRLRTAISWVEPPFVDEKTTEAELRFRVEQVVKDAMAVSPDQMRVVVG